MNLDPWVIVIVGIPKSQQRPRTFFIKGRSKPVTWSKKSTWYSLVYYEALEHRPKEKFEGPLEVKTFFRMPRPKSRKNEVWHITKPDEDNLKKPVFDALTHAQVWRDDSQICVSHFTKQYAVDGFEPGVTIEIEPLYEKKKR